MIYIEPSILRRSSPQNAGSHICFMCIKEFVKPIQNTRTIQVERLVQLPVNPFAGKKIKSEMFPFLAGSTGLTGQPKEVIDYF